MCVASPRLWCSPGTSRLETRTALLRFDAGNAPLQLQTHWTSASKNPILYDNIYIIKCALCNLFGARNPAQIAVYFLQPFCLNMRPSLLSLLLSATAWRHFCRQGFQPSDCCAPGLLLGKCASQSPRDDVRKKAKIQECGNNYDGRKTICGCENQMSDVSKCCVPSFQAEWPQSPQRLGMGNAHTPRRLPLEHAADLPTFLLIEMWLSLRMARMRYCRELTGRNWRVDHVVDSLSWAALSALQLCGFNLWPPSFAWLYYIES